MGSAMPRYVKAPAGIPTAGHRQRSRRLAYLERMAFYGGERWRRFRRAYLNEYPYCVKCSTPEHIVLATLVHHIKERLDYPELAFDPANCEGLCGPCHTAHHKGSHDGA
jgi:5-methylcytosine-specific restriction endonuclease McrA